MRIFQLCQTQVITGFAGIVDINLLAVKMMMDLYGIVDQCACMDKVRSMFTEYMNAIKEKGDAES